MNCTGEPVHTWIIDFITANLAMQSTCHYTHIRQMWSVTCPSTHVEDGNSFKILEAACQEEQCSRLKASWAHCRCQGGAEHRAQRTLSNAVIAV